MDANPSTDNQPTPAPKASKKRNKLVLVVLVLLLAATGGYLLYNRDQDDGAATDYPTTFSGGAVTVSEQGFSPKSITVKVGQNVTWTNGGGGLHQIASDPHPHHDALPGFFNENPLAEGDSYTYTFESAGTFTYHDHLNPIDMQGTVVVE